MHSSTRYPISLGSPPAPKRQTTANLKIHTSRKLSSPTANERLSRTDHPCMKCLKIFKSPAALTAHMEADSERCKIRETSVYGHILHIVSDRFLKMNGRNINGSLKFEIFSNKEDMAINNQLDDFSLTSMVFNNV